MILISSNIIYCNESRVGCGEDCANGIVVLSMNFDTSIKFDTSRYARRVTVLDCSPKPVLIGSRWRAVGGERSSVSSRRQKRSAMRTVGGEDQKRTIIVTIVSEEVRYWSSWKNSISLLLRRMYMKTVCTALNCS